MTRAAGAMAALVVLLGGCASPSEGSTGSAVPGATVFAASSLTTAFTEIADGTEVSFSFDGSAGLLDQIAGGAPADVFASADRPTMDKAVEHGLVDGHPTMFATNTLVLVTPPDNPADVTGLDSSLDGAKLVICAPAVPCGGATHRLAEALDASLAPVSEETSVTDVLGKVTSGEADAGLVYHTDAVGAGDRVHTVGLPGAETDPNTYWIAAVERGDTASARAFIELVTGEDGQAILREDGFGAPSA